MTAGDILLAADGIHQRVNHHHARSGDVGAGVLNSVVAALTIPSRTQPGGRRRRRHGRSAGAVPAVVATTATGGGAWSTVGGGMLAQPDRASRADASSASGRADAVGPTAVAAPCCEGSLYFVIDSSPSKALFVLAQRVAQLEGLQQGAASHRAAHDRAVGGELVVLCGFSRAPGARVPAVLSGSNAGSCCCQSAGRWFCHRVARLSLSPGLPPCHPPCRRLSPAAARLSVWIPAALPLARLWFRSSFRPSLPASVR